ncbi:TonB-linked outer membrane protein, SusC/RagA family [bacterium A37T11]|nr:TonB-linked outer membrane protein, SusC/RagA family [bacterium A37T11]
MRKFFARAKKSLRILVIMKIAYLLTLFSIQVYAAASYSQARVTLHLKNASVKQILTQISESTDCRFIYNDDLLPITDVQDVNVKNYLVSELLVNILQPRGLMYRQVNDKLMVILPDPASKQQDSLMTGRVSLRDNNGKLFTSAGVSVRTVSLKQAVVTDENGHFSIRIPRATTELEIAYMGYTTQRVTISSQRTLEVVLEPYAEQLEDVVITALGIPREKRSLTYATQTLKGGTLSDARETNVTSALNGRVAGLTINKTNSGPGSSNRIVFRGNRSITGNNQPLIVVDGVRIDNTPKALADVTLFGARDNGDGISNINAEDIESMNVLTGPSAAALYGSDASNGAIIITTKSGRKDRRVGIGLSSSYMLENPMIYPKFQNTYGQGEGGLYSAESDQSWGPAMDGQMLDSWTGKSEAFTPQPNNFRDFFRIGGEAINTLTLSAGNELSQTYLSYTNTYSKGIIPGNDFKRNNINLRQTTMIGSKLTADAKINYINEHVINRQPTGEANRAVSTLFRVPRNIRLDDMKDFETLNEDGTLTQNYWKPGSPSMQNPYWSINRNLYDRLRNRLIGLISLKYDITHNMYVQYRSSLDYYTDQTEERDYNDTYWLETPGKGDFITGKESTRQFNNDLLYHYSTDLSEDLHMSINAGASLEQFKFEGTYTDNQGLSVPNLFSLGNALSQVASSSLQKIEKQSVYASANLGYRDFIYLDVSARNDWNSTLPAGNRSYFFPSFGANVLWNSLLKLPASINMLKTRFSYAYVGNGTQFNNLKPSYEIVPGGYSGFLLIDRTLYNNDLKPEQTKSIEGGIDLGLWQNRLSVSATLYKSNTINQILTIDLPNPSGYASRIINAGNIQNKGVEIQVNAVPVQATDFKWDLIGQFGSNKNKVLKLDSLQKKPYLSSPDRIAVIVAEEGGGFGDIYTRGFQRNEAGQILVGANGLPLITDKDFYAGNYNPSWTAGISNTFSYKDLSLSFLIDMRKGGTIVSHTQALMAGAGVAEQTVKSRGETFVIPNSVYEDGTTNVTGITPENYWSYVGGASDPVGELFIYDGTNIRMREISLTYSLPTKWFIGTVIKHASLSLIGRNLFFFHNDADGFDPESALGTGNNQGIEYTSMPSTRNYGIHLKVDF